MTLIKPFFAGLLFGFSLQFHASTFAGTEAYILLQDSPLAGFQYHEGKALWDQLKTGDALTLTREPDNPYDDNAIRVDWQGHKLGYVPRRENAGVARMMDKGQRLQGRITRLQKAHDPWERIRFEVIVPINQHSPEGH